ncbi:MAG: helix-turn-helix domain-containing protein [Clostridia bacterium]|nr:helix-turn-helix domain-containing protein [Clostridia bacterium]
MKSQKQQILDHIMKHGSITPNDADAFGCKRLAARIWDLIHTDGVDIKCKIERGKNRLGAPCTYARYYIGECVDTFKTETVDRLESARSWLTEQQYKVLAGLVNAGDVRGASLGLEKLKRRYEKERKNASA